MNSSASTESSGSSSASSARQLHDDIHRTLESRMARGTARTVEKALKSRGVVLWGAMKRHPFIAAAAIGSCGVAAAVAVGVYELAFGCVLAFGAYKVLREGEPPLSAVSEVVREMRV